MFKGWTFFRGLTFLGGSISQGSTFQGPRNALLRVIDLEFNLTRFYFKSRPKDHSSQGRSSIEHTLTSKQGGDYSDHHHSTDRLCGVWPQQVAEYRQHLRSTQKFKGSTLSTYLAAINSVIATTTGIGRI